MAYMLNKSVRYVNCCLSELAEAARVVLVEEADFVDSVADHGDAFDAKAERPAGPDFGIVADVLEHFGMDHSAAGDFEPVFAHFLHEGAGEIDFEARFGVGE